jgi:serine/threonine-protein kinase/endoribonuclease IRE1
MWITHMPSTPVAAYDGATGRAVKGGLLGGGGGGDILVGAHPGGLFALPSMDGETRGGGDDVLPGTSVATIGAPDGLHGDGALFPVAVSSGARGREDDWACIPEKLWDDALTPGGLDSFLALHGGDPLEGAVLALTPLQRVMGSPVGAAAVVTVAVGFGTVVSYCVLFARTLRRREAVDVTAATSNSSSSKRGNRGKNRGKKNKGKGGVGQEKESVTPTEVTAMEKESADAVPEVLKKLPNKKSSAHGEPARVGPVRIGRLSVGPGILGYGSCGTIVFEGELDGRPVAVKRLLAQFHELARRELATLISSDEHPNVLRCFAMEEDADFVYVALERCVSALASVVDGGSMGTGLDLANKEGRDAFDLVNPATRRPTPEGMTLMRDVCEGLHALHCRGIVHRDLKPQNVLVTPQRRGKLADMGLAKRLGVGIGDGASFETHLAGVGGTDHGGNNGGGTAGWQAPERLLHGKQARSVDTFSLGCLVHYCLTGGAHPFGDRYERDANVLKGDVDLRRIAHLPEATDLVRRLVAREPGARPTAAEVLLHPFWWSDAKALAFLCDVSDRVEMEDREIGGAALLESLEKGAMRNALGGGEWVPKLDPSLLENLGRYRRYNPRAVRDLLRVVRNKMSHFRELPAKVQATVGAPPDGFYRYFASRFPGLLLHVHSFATRECAHEPTFRRYFFPHEEDGAGRGAGDVAASLTRASSSMAAPAKVRAAKRAAAAELAADSVEYPERPGEPECVFWVKTGRCKFGAGCRFNHPRGTHG